jgi:cation:H+ antiporter
LALLAWASEQFVIGASHVATGLRVSAVLIGAVVIGFGTSLPELLVTILAAADGAADIALGNVVGSNIANLTLVLGAAAVLTPIAVAAPTVRREALVSLGAVLVLAIALQAGVGRIEGAILMALMVAALWFLVASEPDKGPRKRKAEVENLGRGLPLEAGRTIVGLGGTLAGAQLLVIGARGIAETAGLSEGFVGLTIVAVGTSLPELFAAIQSGRRGQTDLILGNVLGSNIFNSLGIAGLAMLIDPGQVASNVAQTGAIAMSVIAIAAFVMMARGRIGRIEGAMLLIAFVVLVPLLQ